MTLVNETGVGVNYQIASSSQSDCGSIDVDGVANLPDYDNQQNVTVSFLPVDGSGQFTTIWEATGTGGQTEMCLVAE
ncbi:MAG: hypothetical protein ACXW3C_06995 [Pyrinomonadaceae bacterium]